MEGARSYSCLLLPELRRSIDVGERRGSSAYEHNFSIDYQKENVTTYLLFNDRKIDFHARSFVIIVNSSAHELNCMIEGDACTCDMFRDH